MAERDSEQVWSDHMDKVFRSMYDIYMTKVLQIENRYQYSRFHKNSTQEIMRQRKPFVTFIGPFSTGKSTFINYLLQTDFLATGPQPVTDKFHIIMYGETKQVVPGHVLLGDPKLPYHSLGEFGSEFAESLQGIFFPHPLLKYVSIIDTPGVLEAAGQMRARRYDYVKACKWFMGRSDLVVFLFDPHKLDAGTELQSLFKHALAGQESKVRIILNKADSVSPQELVRVYGALYWNLSNLIASTEPPRVYVSSFWGEPYQKDTDHALFQDEKEDLLYELIEQVPAQFLDRRVVDLLKHVRDVRILVLICGAFKSRLPALFGRKKAKQRFFMDYFSVVEELAEKYKISACDFPTSLSVEHFLTGTSTKHFLRLEDLESRGVIRQLTQVMDVDLPKLLKPIKEQNVLNPSSTDKINTLRCVYTGQNSMP